MHHPELVELLEYQLSMTWIYGYFQICVFIQPLFTPTSDIQLIMLYEQLPKPLQQSITIRNIHLCDCIKDTRCDSLPSN